MSDAGHLACMLWLRSCTDAAVRPYPSCQLSERVLYLEPLRRDVLYEMVGNPETLLVDSTLLSVLHPRQVSQGSGFWGMLSQ
jgi:hypothetical protein